ncbi:MAG TPA: DUF3987 domain-containing protein [Bacteroidales bacterium]|nr:DUF3987 domain-containing protein [Bacteroidales bacterium]
MFNNELSMALPGSLNEINRRFAEMLNVNEAVVISQTLTVLGWSLCNRYESTITSTWYYRPNLWCMSVLPSGANKSGSLDTAFKPLESLNAEVYSKYLKQKEAWEAVQKAERQKSRKQKDPESVTKSIEEIDRALNYKLYNAGHNITVDKPVKYECYLENMTMQGMLRSLMNNEGRAAIIRYDEIAGFYTSLNNSGSDETDLNKLYDYSSYKKTRQDSTLDAFIREKTVSLISTTQKKFLFDIFKQMRIDNGNLFRFLFVFESSDGDDKRFVNPFNINIGKKTAFEDAMRDYMELFNHFLPSYESTPSRINLQITDEVMIHLAIVRDEITQYYADKCESGLLASIIAKFDGYLVKFAIILNRIWAYYENTEDDITLKDVDFDRASVLVKYYLDNTLKVLEYVSNPANRLVDNPKELDFIAEMPDNFSTSAFIDKYIVKYNCGKRTAEKYLSTLKNKGLIRKNKQGEYYKATIEQK